MGFGTRGTGRCEWHVRMVSARSNSYDCSLPRHSALQHYEDLVQRGKWAQLAALFDGAATERGLPQCSKTQSAISRRLEGMEEDAIIERMFAEVSGI